MVNFAFAFPWDVRSLKKFWAAVGKIKQTYLIFAFCIGINYMSIKKQPNFFRFIPIRSMNSEKSIHFQTEFVTIRNDKRITEMTVCQRIRCFIRCYMQHITQRVKVTLLVTLPTSRGSHSFSKLTMIMTHILCKDDVSFNCQREKQENVEKYFLNLLFHITLVNSSLTNYKIKSLWVKQVYFIQNKLYVWTLLYITNTTTILYFIRASYYHKRLSLKHIITEAKFHIVITNIKNWALRKCQRNNYTTKRSCLSLPCIKFKKFHSCQYRLNVRNTKHRYIAHFIAALFTEQTNRTTNYQQGVHYMSYISPNVHRSGLMTLSGTLAVSLLFTYINTLYQIRINIYCKLKGCYNRSLN